MDRKSIMDQKSFGNQSVSLIQRLMAPFIALVQNILFMNFVDAYFNAF